MKPIRCKQLITDLLSSINTRLHKYETNVLYWILALSCSGVMNGNQGEIDECKNIIVAEMQKFAAISTTFSHGTSSSTMISDSSPSASSDAVHVSELEFIAEPANKITKINLFSF